MQSIELRGMKEIQKAFEKFPDAVKKAKAAELDELGFSLYGEVRQNIGGSGRVAGVQEYQVGSGKGYVAVRPMGRTEVPRAKGRKKSYRAGVVTAALEHGHITVNRYVISAQHVPGKEMYQKAGTTQAPRLAEAAARSIEQTIMKEMGF